MADVFNFLKSKADLSRNAFDMNQRHIYSAKVSMKLPVLAIDCVPGDYHEIDVMALTRTMPVRTDAFARLKQNFEFIYVPYQQIWRDWNDFILQNKEDFSSLDISRSLPTVVPTVSLTAVLNRVFSSLVDDEKDMFGYSKAHNALRMLDLLGYGSHYYMVDVFNSGDSDAIAAMKEQWNTSYGDYGTTESDYYNTVQINIWRIAAYQKACNDYCRNSYYTPSDASLFNVDSWLGAVPSVRTGLAFEMLAHIWYGMYKKDMFTGLMTSPQFGAVSAVSMSDIQIVNVQNSLDSSRNAAGAIVNSQSQGAALRSQGVTSSVNDTKWNISNAFDVYALRKAEAMQKWKEDRLRAGNKNRNISETIYGTTSRYLANKYSDYVGSFDANMSIDEVVNMSAQGSAELGEVAGKGIGTAGGKISYKTSEFGVLLCLYSIQPSAEYDAVGLDKNNTLMEPFDYFEPHFENLGFDGVYQYQLNNLPAYERSALAKTLGYAPRFLNYKTAIDKVHGEFMSIGHGVSSEDSGEFVSWTTPRVDIEASQLTPSSVNEAFFYVNPSVLNPIFAQDADSSQSTDQFLVNCNFAIRSVRNMSVLGLPRW